MRVMLFDAYGTVDVGTVTSVAGDQVRVQHSGALSSRTERRRGHDRSRRLHLLPCAAIPPPAPRSSVRYDGFQTDRPVVDNVVAMAVEYLADPRPPRVLPAPEAGDPIRPITSYGPAPPPSGVDNPHDLWGPGENCVFTDAGGPVPRLGVLGPGLSPVPLDPAQLRDGPWCPDALHATRFDADLLRVRRVRLRLRVQVAVAAMRGPAGRLFARGGTAVSADLFAPDQQLVLDIAPRNLGGAP